MFGFPSGMGGIMNAFFGDFDDFTHAGFQHKTKRTSHALPVTLADLYNGKRIEMPYTQTIPCLACDGRGSKGTRAGVCSGCRGRGCRVMMRQMGMMMQQMTINCDICGGSGRRIDPRDVCSVCQGKKVTIKESLLSVEVEQGMQHHEQLVFHGEGDWDFQTGEYEDIVIVLEQMKNEVFVRENNDLHITHTITLAESLCGFQFVLKHLDGRDLIVRRERGEITRPGEVKIVTGEGMPIRQRPGQFGDLVIKFQVNFPDRLEKLQVDVLRAALPPPKSVDINHCDLADECYVTREDFDCIRKEMEKDAKKEKGDGQTARCTAQ